MTMEGDGRESAEFWEVNPMVVSGENCLQKRLLTFFNRDVLSGKRFKGDFLQRQIYGKSFKKLSFLFQQRYRDVFRKIKVLR
jgi:hypothetical protein